MDHRSNPVAVREVNEPGLTLERLDEADRLTAGYHLCMTKVYARKEIGGIHVPDESRGSLDRACEKTGMKLIENFYPVCSSDFCHFFQAVSPATSAGAGISAIVTYLPPRAPAISNNSTSMSRVACRPVAR